MTPQDLKNSILQLAMQGKLVEQRPEEGTGEELYQQIQKEKQKLIKEGKIKKDKPLAEITDDEKPFEIPESWKWIRLDDICTKTIKRGKSPKYVQKSNTLVFAQKCNTKAGHIDLSIALYLDEAIITKYPVDEFMIDNDIVVNSTGNGTLGRVGIYRDTDNGNRLPIVPDSHVTVIRTGYDMSVSFVFHCLRYYQPYMEKLGSGSTNQTELSANVIKTLCFPVPPLAEQKRIVAKIEELMPYVEQYGSAYTKLETFNKKFPGDMKKSILQLAMQGKLVEQRPEEGTGEELYQQIQKEKQKLIKEGKIKKEKPLPEITDDEKPFEIPDSWRWVRLNGICDSIVDCPHSTPQYLHDDSGFAAIDTNCINSLGNITGWRYVSKDAYNKRVERLVPAAGDVILTREGSYGRAAILPQKIKVCLGQRVMLLRFSKNIDNELYRMFIMSPQELQVLTTKQKGIGAKHINVADIFSLVMPLPPLAEQKRIATKIEELMPYCEKLQMEE